MHPLIKPFCLLTLPPHFWSTSLSAKFPTWHSSFNLYYWILQSSVLYFQVSLFMNLGLDLQRHIMRRLSPLILNKLVFFWRCTLSFRFDSTKSLQYSESQKMIAKTILYFFRGAEDGREATERCEGYCPGNMKFK